MGQGLSVPAFVHAALSYIHFAACMEIFPPVGQSHDEQEEHGHKTDLQPLRIVPVFDQWSASRTESQICNLHRVGRTSDIGVAARADGLADERHVKGRKPSFLPPWKLFGRRIRKRRAIQVEEGAKREG